MTDISETSGGRAKRQKLDKHGRFAALEKLKNLKGSKHKYEETGISNVYEEVDEREYSKRVLERQDDDWIEDDDGAGYVEDGREIFDDDMDDDAIRSASKNSSKGKSNKTNRISRKEPAVSDVKTGNIRSMFMNIPSKKKKDSVVKLDEDKLLGDIMQELSSAPAVKPSPIMRSYSGPRTSFNGSSISRLSDGAPRACRNVFGVNANSISSVEDIIPPSPLPSVLPLKRNASGNEKPGLVPESQCIEEIESQSFSQAEDITIDDMGDSFDDEDFKPLIQEAMEVKQEKIPEVVAVEPVAEVKMETSNNCIKDEPSEGEVTVESKLELAEGTLPMEKSLVGEGDEVFRFFWWDAVEGPPGTVYLFGKVKCKENFFSCCVTVKNIERQVYLLPREEIVNPKTGASTGEKVSIMDVYNEFNDQVATQHKIFEFKSRKVVRKYAFEHADVPLSSEYLEVRYPASHAALPRDFSGRTFSRVFGTESSFLELLLLDRRIKGPCWMEVSGVEAAKNKLSWCAVEALASGGDAVTPLTRESSETLGSPPPLTILSLTLRTAPNHRTGLSEVVLAGGVIKRGFRIDAGSTADGSSTKKKDESFCIIARPDRIPWPRDCDAHLRVPGRRPVVRVDSERALLSVFLAKVYSLDPDVVVGHGISDFELEVIAHRLTTLGVSQPSRISRLRRANDPRNAKGGAKSKDRPQYKDRYPLAGRLMCDTKVSAKELIKSRTYELRPLCRKVLDGYEDDTSEEQEIVDKDEVSRAYLSGATLASFISKVEMEAYQVLRLMEALDALPLALQITSIAGNVFSRTLTGGRSERNEFLLLHAFSERGFLVPDKTFRSRAPKGVDEKATSGPGKGRREAAYAGGLVLEPMVGLYDTLILLMDFNSLYPSIIQEYNICFTTLPRHLTAPSGGDVDIQALLEKLPDADTEQGVLPSEIRKLVESRRAVKQLMSASNLTAAQRRQYDVRQMALKLTANSMYGCLGFGESRFQARELAALVTAKGREILSRTKDLVQEKLGLTVVYGDTDSVMIDTRNTDYAGALKVGSKIKAEVNKMYRQVELDIDGVFERMLLLKKKKYAALLVEQKGQQLMRRMELKGLDIVRRDWSRISVEAGKFVVSQLLGADNLKADLDERLDRITSYLESLKEELESGNMATSKLIITKQLTKSPEAYSDAKSLPHVQVALRYNSQPGARPLLRGDTVPYIICKDGSGNSSAQRAYHPEELSKRQLPQDGSSPLVIDFHYYLAHQVHPVVSRLCSPIPGMDANRIAVCLGMDPVFTQKPVLQSEGITNTINVDTTPEMDFRECEKFKFTCMSEKCRTVNEIDGPYRKTDAGKRHALSSCVNPDCTTSPLKYLPSIQNALTMAMRKHISCYYAGWLICEDPGCPTRVRRVPTHVRGPHPVCTGCWSGCMMREYSETQLYTQLMYYADMFDLEKSSGILENGDEKPHSSAARDVEAAYSKLHDQVSRVLATSAYAVIDLEKLFTSFKHIRL